MREEKMDQIVTFEVLNVSSYEELAACLYESTDDNPLPVHVRRKNPQAGQSGQPFTDQLKIYLSGIERQRDGLFKLSGKVMAEDGSWCSMTLVYSKETGEGELRATVGESVHF